VVGVVKSRTLKQLASDKRRSAQMKGTRPAFLKGKKSKSRSVSKSKGGGGSHKSKDLTIPLSIAIPAAIPLVKALTFNPATGQNGLAFDQTMEGAKQTYRSLALSYSGYDIDTNEWKLGELLVTYGSLALGVAAHKYLGGAANRILGSSNVPIIRV